MTPSLRIEIQAKYSGQPGFGGQGKRPARPNCSMRQRRALPPGSAALEGQPGRLSVSA